MKAGVVLGLGALLQSCIVSISFDRRSIQRHVAEGQPQGHMAYFVEKLDRYVIDKGKTPEGNDMYLFDSKGDNVRVNPPVGFERVKFSSELEKHLWDKPLPGQLHDIKDGKDIVRTWVLEYPSGGNLNEHELYMMSDTPAKIELGFRKLNEHKGGGPGGSGGPGGGVGGGPGAGGAG